MITSDEWASVNKYVESSDKTELLREAWSLICGLVKEIESEGHTEISEEEDRFIDAIFTPKEGESRSVADDIYALHERIAREILDQANNVKYDNGIPRKAIT